MMRMTAQIAVSARCTMMTSLEMMTMTKTDRIMGVFTKTIKKLSKRAEALDTKNIEIMEKKVALQEQYVNNKLEIQQAQKYAAGIQKMLDGDDV